MLLSLFSTLSFHHFHRTHTHTPHTHTYAVPTSVDLLYFWLFSRFCTHFSALQNFMSIYKRIVCAAICEPCRSRMWLISILVVGRTAQFSFFPSNFTNDTLMPYSFAFETYIYLCIDRSVFCNLLCIKRMPCCCWAYTRHTREVRKKTYSVCDRFSIYSVGIASISDLGWLFFLPLPM